MRGMPAVAKRAWFATPTSDRGAGPLRQSHACRARHRPALEREPEGSWRGNKAHGRIECHDAGNGERDITDSSAEQSLVVGCFALSRQVRPSAASAVVVARNAVVLGFGRERLAPGPSGSEALPTAERLRWLAPAVPNLTVLPHLRFGAGTVQAVHAPAVFDLGCRLPELR